MMQGALTFGAAPPDARTALLIEAHRAHRVRILGPAPGRAKRLEVAIVGNGERRTLAPAELVPDAPLTAREEAEYRRLDARLAGQDRPLQDDYRRFEALRLRSLVHAGAETR
jgi:hypothetical protein